jgi:hypothetical protein
MTNTYVIDLAARYAAVFGAMALSEKSYRNAVVVNEDNKYSVDLYPEFDSNVENVKFEYENTILEFNNMLMNEGSAFFAPPPIMSFSREKNLIITEVSGSDSEVIERWGTKPWTINVTILLIDIENKQYPSDRIREISRIFEHNGVVRVEGAQFEEKDIDSVYFEDIDIKPIDGFSDTVQVSLTMKSIKEVFYTLLKPND